jgi:hypothetical protein
VERQTEGLQLLSCLQGAKVCGGQRIACLSVCLWHVCLSALEWRQACVCLSVFGMAASVISAIQQERNIEYPRRVSAHARECCRW